MVRELSLDELLICEDEGDPYRPLSLDDLLS